MPTYSGGNGEWWRWQHAQLLKWQQEAYTRAIASD